MSTNEIREHIPIIALRGVCILPGMMVHFDIKKGVSMAGAQAAMEQEQLAFLVTQKNEGTDRPEEKDLEEIGTLSVVRQIVRMPGDAMRVMVTGIRRGHLDEITAREPFLQGTISVLTEGRADLPDPLRAKAMVLLLKDTIRGYVERSDKIDRALLNDLDQIESLDKLIDQAAIVLPLSMKRKQSVLSELTLRERFTCMMTILEEETEVENIRRDFQKKVKEEIDRNQKEYILREQLKVIHDELGENAESEAEEFKRKLEALEANEEVKEKIGKEIRRFQNMPSNAAEATVLRGYIETLLDLPWDHASVDNYDLKNAKKILDRDHYGLEKVKERILEFLAVRALTEKGRSPIICLVGPPGTGKTSIGRSIAEALGKQYVRLALGGVRDEAEIRGHRRTYIGSMPGRIVTAMKNAGVKNPLMLLDEIDKLGNDYKGDPASAMLEVLDGEQNSRFADHYIEIPVDLSEVLFIATANSTETIPRPLLDRMEIIEINSYTANEKFHIAKEHLVAKQLEVNGLKPDQLSITDKALSAIISGYTREAGVRALVRRIGEICRKAAREIMENGAQTTCRVTARNLEQYLGKILYTPERRNAKPDVGIVRGLAWTSMGGVTLEVEVNVPDGRGEVMLTGQLGDVMKESAGAALTYVRSACGDCDAEYFEKHDIHIHIPEGAVPKDGPSAGITMATAIYSAVTGKKVRADVAMTGEITLRGRVLAIGGLKEKLLAANSAGMKTVIVPEENRRDVRELSEEILGSMEIIYASNMQQVLQHALVQG